MHEDLGQKINRTWANSRDILLAELINPGSTNLDQNPFSWVPANIPFDKVTWRDLNNMPMRIAVEDSYYRQLPEDIGENETLGQYAIRNEDSWSSDRPSTRFINHSLKYLNSTKGQIYSDFDEAMSQAGVTCQQIIEAGMFSNEARELLFPVYVILRNMGYGHQDFTM